MQMDLVNDTPATRRRPGKWFGALLILLAFVGSGAVVALFMRGDALSQADELFAGLGRALEDGMAREVMACVDEEYPCFELWPILREHPLAEPAAADRERRRQSGREAAEAALRYAFTSQMLNRDVTRTFTYEIHSVTPLGDDLFEADVSFELAVTGSRLGAVPETRNVPFVLRRTGWLFPTMRILKHPPIKAGGT